MPVAVVHLTHKYQINLQTTLTIVLSDQLSPDCYLYSDAKEQRKSGKFSKDIQKKWS